MRFRQLGREHARQLMEEACATGKVVAGRLAWTVDVRVKVVDPGREELVSVAFAAEDAPRSTDIVSAFDPEKRDRPEWRVDLPGEITIPGEVAFTVVRAADDVSADPTGKL